MAKAGEREAPTSDSLTVTDPVQPQTEWKHSTQKISRVTERMMNNYIKPVCKLACLAIAILGSGLVSCVWSADQKSAPPPQTNAPPAVTNSAVVQTPPSTKRVPAPRKRLSGAELYSMHCNRCHPERYPTERTAAQWKTIMLHMQVRVNLPADQAKLILKYLQENSGR